MSGFDRAVLSGKLMKLGWTEDDDGKMIPSLSLFKDMPQSFDEYDAEALQNLLGESVPED